MADPENSSREAGFVPPQLGKESLVPGERSIPINVGGTLMDEPEISVFAKVREAVRRGDWGSLAEIFGHGKSSSDQSNPSDRE